MDWGSMDLDTMDLDPMDLDPMHFDPIRSDSFPGLPKDASGSGDPDRVTCPAPGPGAQMLVPKSPATDLGPGLALTARGSNPGTQILGLKSRA